MASSSGTLHGSTLNADDNMLHRGSASSMSIEISSGHGQVPQQLEDYFDLVTQFKLAQKRERDWQMTFRELVKDDDSIIDQSDEDFVRTWGANLSGGQKYLNETLVALQATQMTCEKHNIDTRACQLSILPSHTGLQTPSVTGTEANLGQREPGTSSATPIEPESSNDMSMRCFAMIRPFYAFPPRYSPPPMTNLELYMQMIRGEPGPGMTLSTDGTDSGERTRLDGPQRAQSSDKRPRVVRESRLPAELNGREILAFPDVGAAANFIALRYVHSQGLTINSKARKLVHTAVGSVVDIMGTVTLPFSFRGEQKVHELEFNVMRNAVHEVIIGSPFLKLTKTFTRYKHRLQQMLREVRLPRMRYLGSHQYLRGQVNGSYVDAVPDTGADVPVMSMSFAREHGFKVATDPRHRVLLEFADGSAATSIGMVKDMDWSFRGSNYRHRINVYVLEELQTGLILDNTFLYDTDAFVAHGRDFWTDEEGSLEDGWMVSIIKLVDRALKGSRCTISSTSSADLAAKSDEAWRLEKSRQLNAYSLARKHAQSMTKDQREAFLQPHLAQGKQILESCLDHSASSQSSISSITGSACHHVGTPAPTVVAPTTTKRPGFFKKLRVLK